MIYLLLLKYLYAVSLSTRPPLSLSSSPFAPYLSVIDSVIGQIDMCSSTRACSNVCHFYGFVYVLLVCGHWNPLSWCTTMREFDDVNFHEQCERVFPNMISVSAILDNIAFYGIDSHSIQSNLYSHAHFNRTLQSSTVFYLLLLILWHECKLIITYLHRYLL